MPDGQSLGDGQSGGQLTGRCQSVMAACSSASPRDRTQVITVDVCSLIADPSAAAAARLHALNIHASLRVLLPGKSYSNNRETIYRRTSRNLGLFLSSNIYEIQRVHVDNRATDPRALILL